MFYLVFKYLKSKMTLQNGQKIQDGWLFFLKTVKQTLHLRSTKKHLCCCLLGTFNLNFYQWAFFSFHSSNECKYVCLYKIFIKFYFFRIVLPEKKNNIILIEKQLTHRYIKKNVTDSFNYILTFIWLRFKIITFFFFFFQF
jgi:hypothetical protein